MQPVQVKIRSLSELLGGGGGLQHDEGRAKSVVLCGSTRFMEYFDHYNRHISLLGSIVLSVATTNTRDWDPSPAQKAWLDVLHLNKIANADAVVVLNVDGYMGESTLRETLYAIRLGKPVAFLEDPRKVLSEIPGLLDAFPEGRWPSIEEATGGLIPRLDKRSQV